MRHRKKSGIELYFNLLSPKVELEKWDLPLNQKQIMLTARYIRVLEVLITSCDI